MTVGYEKYVAVITKMVVYCTKECSENQLESFIFFHIFFVPYK